jgi:NTP pyrophosphatase (non-canonical NTP hydrolase)
VLKKRKKGNEGRSVVSIEKVQNMMRRIYFARDAERGAEGTYRWFKEEVEELGDAMRKSDREALENEFADVVAWLASLANVLQVNLETAVSRKYDNHCPKCSSSPCECAFKREKVKQSSAAVDPRQ